MNRGSLELNEPIFDVLSGPGAGVVSGERNRRDSIEILLTLLDILITSGTSSKTRLMNQANLNPASFNRYIVGLERAGAVERREGDGNARLLYVPTPRARSLRLLLRVLHSALNPDARLLNEYNRITRIVRAWAASRGYRLYPDDLGVYDYIAVGEGKRLGILVSIEGDTSSLFRAALLLLDEGLVKEKLVVISGSDGWRRNLERILADSARITEPEELERLS